MNEYEQAANEFCDSHGFVLHADYVGDGMCPPWCKDNQHVHGDHYRVSLMRKDDEDSILEFDYWNSQNSKEKGERPSNYELLACISSMAHTSTDPYEVEQEFGVDDDHARLIANEAERHHSFFSAEELEDLCIIQ